MGERDQMAEDRNAAEAARYVVSRFRRLRRQRPEGRVSRAHRDRPRIAAYDSGAQTGSLLRFAP